MERRLENSKANLQRALCRDNRWRSIGQEVHHRIFGFSSGQAIAIHTPPYIRVRIRRFGRLSGPTCSRGRGRPRYPVLVHRAAALLDASFRPHLAMTPLVFAIPSPPSGWIESLECAFAHRRDRRTDRQLERAVPPASMSSLASDGVSGPTRISTRTPPWSRFKSRQDEI